MPQIKPRPSSSGKSRKSTAKAPEPIIEEVRVSSVLFGLAILIALVVATAAWMGGSLSKVESRFANTMDGTARSVGLSVSVVDVIGLSMDGRLEADIRAAAMIEPGENMFRADPDTIRRRVMATGKVSAVRVHRLWPDQVVIIAEPARAAALWTDGRVWAVVDDLGRIMPKERVSDHADQLKLAGTGAPGAAPVLIAALKDAPDMTRRIKVATRIAERRWDLTLYGGAVIRMPEDAELAAAMSKFGGLEARTKLTLRPVSIVDLRLPDRVFLTPAGAGGGKATREGA